ncbi:bolA-like protein DDB_G0274169 [Strongylocentrotus purpuratus]|uniref:BolA-like protein 1 n=1 Tax=Strongylocentrotus purpuratus TaxID=7668 RepID=A0A7M7GPJ7_STRPU|nr:bolA-like protein DDB_G0274169 [Strongylocentrotus purpuratus]|eukprot:XP_003725927.1 PREDICTED: bolA-like protein DDB_G0274169 [Strongylocentrotus purpuratus]
MISGRATIIVRRAWAKQSALRKVKDSVVPGPSPAIGIRTIHTSKTRTMASESGSIESSIKDKLMQKFQPTHLEVINESSMHNVPRGSETHFKVVVVSEAFDKESLIKRHCLVNEVLKTELEGPVHALSIQAKTPSQWSSNATVTKSPPCLGGMAREQRDQQGT